MFTLRPDTMLRRNSKAVLILVIFFAWITQVIAQGAPPASQNPPAASPSPATAGQAPAEKSGDIFVFRKEVDEVTLHATVVDDKNHIVTGLDRADFTVFEDGQPQKITSFRHEDIPVAVGIVIDNSGSMRDKRPAVNAAAINFVKASNPQDKVFIVNFNEDYFLDQDYTASVPKLKDALERIEARGGTALYDAVVASSDHLKKSGLLEKKVLLVVTDGEDNSSRESLEQAIRRLQEENGPTVYTIGLLGEEHSKRARRALRQMAEETGGIAFFPQGLGDGFDLAPALREERDSAGFLRHLAQGSARPLGVFLAQQSDGVDRRTILFLQAPDCLLERLAAGVVFAVGHYQQDFLFQQSRLFQVVRRRDNSIVKGCATARFNSLECILEFGNRRGVVLVEKEVFIEVDDEYFVLRIAGLHKVDGGCIHRRALVAHRAGVVDHDPHCDWNVFPPEGDQFLRLAIFKDRKITPV